jgi:proteasome component ECM29
VAFLGRHDKDTKVSQSWNDVWDEGGAAINSEHDGVFGVLLQEKLLPYIVKACVSSLQSTSWANRKAGCAVIVELNTANILAPISRSMNDDFLPSGQEIDRMRQRANASSVLLSQCVKVIARRRIWEGKGDVVNAATLIAGKWSSAVPIEAYRSIIWPVIQTKEKQDDLFDGDDWFKRPDMKIDDVNDDVGGDDVVIMTDAINSEENVVLDMKEDYDAGNEEQVNYSENEDTNTEAKSTKQLIMSGFCRVLLDQSLVTSNNSTDDVLPYKVAAISGLTSLLTSVAPTEGSASYHDTVDFQHFMYDLVGPRLFSFISDNQDSTAPVLIARALECLAAAMYIGIGIDSAQSYADPGVLLRFFAESTTKQPAWTVRQASALAASSLVACMPSAILRRTESIKLVLDCSNETLKDKKFWKVRLAGLELLHSLVSRVGNQKMSVVDAEKQLIMEAILPYKELIIGVARKSLADNESQVTAAASKITQSMAWWP